MASRSEEEEQVMNPRPVSQVILRQLVEDELRKLGVNAVEAQCIAEDLAGWAQEHRGRRMFAMLAYDHDAAQ